MRAFARQMIERMKAVAAAGAVAAFWLAVWVFVAALVAQPLILPGPGAVVVALLRLVCDVGTWAILAGSGVRILGGLALAAVCGGLLAGISSRSRAFARLVAPALSFVKATPVACVVVLLLIWLGSARVSIAAVFLMALPGVYFSLVEGLTQADKPLEQMFRLHGVRGWRLFCAHTWREVLPFVLSCARAVISRLHVREDNAHAPAQQHAMLRAPKPAAATPARARMPTMPPRPTRSTPAGQPSQ